MPAGSGGRDATALIEKAITHRLGSGSEPEAIVPLLVTAIVLRAEVGMATAELVAKMPGAVDFDCAENAPSTH